jgi:hypothetical protein
MEYESGKQLRWFQVKPWIIFGNSNIKRETIFSKIDYEFKIFFFFFFLKLEVVFLKKKIILNIIILKESKNTKEII